MQYRQVLSIGGRGLRAEQFREALRGICIDRANRLFTAGDDEVKVFGSDGKLLQRWKTEKPGHCVLVSDHGTVYVGQANQVQRYDDSGKLLNTLRDGERLGLVTSIGLAGGDLLLADATHRCIRRYDKDGKLLNDIGTNNNTNGFLVPNGHLDFAVDARGVLHVANPGKYRIERYMPAGELLGHFGRFGTRNVEDFPGCCNPTNVTLTRQGQVVVTEKAPARVKVYDEAGKLLTFIGPEAFDQNCKNMDVAVDSQGRIYVVDTVNLRILVFAPGEQAPGSTPATTTKGAT
jgi:sugar lactone lactonase YvrE